MSSNLLDRIRGSFSLRLTLWYAAVSILAYVVLFVLAYQSLSASLVKEDRQIILSRYKEYANKYQKGGLTHLEMFINAKKNSGKPMPFFVRVADPDNATLYLSLPEQWGEVDLSQIGNLSVDTSEQQLHIRRQDGEMVFQVISAPLKDGNFLQIGKDIERRTEFLNRFRHVFLSAMIPAILIGIMGGHFLASQALRPVRQLTHTMRSVIETGNMEARVPAGTTENELNDLVLLFNQMLAKIEDLVQGMRESLDNVAHDLRTPLTRMRGIAEMALQSSQDLEGCQEALADCLEESERIVKILNTLMDIAEAETGTLRLDTEQMPISRLIEEVVELYRYVAEEKNIVVRTDFSENLQVAIDPHRMRQVLANLLDNAIKYTPDGGRVVIETTQGPKQMTIAMKDTGPGIPEEEISKIWNRLFRGDKSRSQRGLGLGLSLVRSIVKAHGGYVDVSSQTGVGSTFTVHLPQAG